MAKPNAPSLYKMLTYRRAHNSPGEKQFILDFIIPLKPEIIATDTKEPMAFIVRVGKSDIMFTSHVDTVHMMHAEVFQKVILKDGLYQKNDNQPLGADDAAGVWLMINMIQAKVPGVYAFFRGEERGGIGSSYCAEHRKDLFEGIKCAIAFDRKGTSSIITHQGSGRGCSDEFAQSLADILGMGHKLDTTGVYTDTAEFFELVPNCTNVSVGYFNEHTKKETLNKIYIEALLAALIKADWSKLDHTPPKPDSVRSTNLFGDNYNSLFDPVDDSNVDALDIADYIYDHFDKLPDDLQVMALDLAKRIYLNESI